MIKEDELELRRIRLVDDEGNIIGDLSAVSIVDKPAIKMSTMWFKQAEIKTLNFAATKDKQLIVGPAMRVDFPILQKEEIDGKTNYYNVFFTEADVRAGAELFMTRGNHNQANFNHRRLFSDEIQMVESWIVEDPEMDKAKALGYDMSQVKKGDWFMTYKVVETDLWEEMKAQNFEGFSVEVGGFEEKVASSTKDYSFSDELAEIEEVIANSPNLNVRSKYTLLYNLIKDIVFAEDMEDDSKYRLIRGLLKKI